MRISRSEITIGGIPSKTSLSDEGLPNPPNGAPATPFSMALALLQYEKDGELRFPTAEPQWGKFRQNLAGLKKDFRPWAEDFIGSAERLFLLFKTSPRDISVNTQLIARSDVQIGLATVEGATSVPELQTLLADKLAGNTSAGGRSKKKVSIEEIEPDEKIRNALILTARKGLGLSGLQRLEEILLGKAVYLSKSQELEDAVANCQQTMMTLKDDIAQQAGDPIQIVESHAIWAIRSERLQQLAIYTEEDDSELLESYVKKVECVGEELVKALDREYATDAWPPNQLIAAVQSVIDASDAVIADLKVKVNGCGDRLKSYCVRLR